MLNRKVTLKRLMFGCMLGQAPKCLTARWTPKDVYFRNAMRVKPSLRTKHIALAGDLSVPQVDAAPRCLQNTYIPDSLVHQSLKFERETSESPSTRNEKPSDEITNRR